MLKMSLPCKPKRRKIVCLLCRPDVPAFDSDYRSKHNNKYHKTELAKGRSIPYKDKDAPANPFAASCGLKAKIRDSVEKTDDSTILERPVDIAQPEEAESHGNEESAREYKKGHMITAGSTSESQDVATDESADFVCCSMVDLSADFPSDPAHFLGVPMTPECAGEILKIGPCQPGKRGKFNFPVADDDRSFCSAWYTDGKYDRDWLVYSPLKNKMYCFACWLFPCKELQSFRSNWAMPKLGINKWKQGLEKIGKHEGSKAHLMSVGMMMQTRLRLANEKSICAEQLRVHKKKIEENRAIMKRLIDVTLHLARQNCSFRGDNELGGRGGSEVNEGNYIETCKLLANYDKVIRDHLDCGKGNERYTSSSIQNDIIFCAATIAKEKVLQSVRDNKYFSLIIDGSTDASKRNQLSFNIRYVDMEFGIINESFVCLHNMQHKENAENLFDCVMKMINEWGLNFSNCRGQGYDGAAVMAGKRSGLRTRLQEENNLAVYVHCNAHNLNLVLCAACDGNDETRKFFSTLSGLYDFVMNARNRLYQLWKHCMD